MDPRFIAFLDEMGYSGPRDSVDGIIDDFNIVQLGKLARHLGLTATANMLEQAIVESYCVTVERRMSAEDARHHRRNVWASAINDAIPVVVANCVTPGWPQFWWESNTLWGFVGGEKGMPLAELLRKVPNCLDGKCFLLSTGLWSFGLKAEHINGSFDLRHYLGLGSKP